MIKPDLIFLGDVHATENIPLCRTDDYIKEFEIKCLWLRKIQEKYQCPIISVGDLLEYWKATPKLLSWCYDHLPNNIITIPGNHDLPAHNLSLLNQSGITTLHKFKKIQILVNDYHRIESNENIIDLYPFPWKSPFYELESNSEYEYTGIRKIAICHVMVYTGKLPWPGCKSDSTKTLMNKLKGYDTIVTGDNHEGFEVEYNGKILINPGSFTRTTSIQKNHRPAIYLWESKTNTYEKVFVPIKQGVISDDHIVSKQQQEQKDLEFIQSLNTNEKTTPSFQNNLKMFFENNRVRKAVQEKTWACLEKN